MEFTIDLTRIVMHIIRTLAVILFVVVVISFVTSFQLIVKDKDIDRISIEVAENIMSSPIAVNRAVFASGEVEKVSKSYGAENGANIEPYGRTCSVGYYITIEDLETDKALSFGYRPSVTRIDSPLIREYPVGIFVPGQRQGDFYNTVHPAKLRVEVHDSWLTRATCLAEKAYATRRVEYMKIPCIFVPGSDKCTFSLKRTAGGGDHLCVFRQRCGSSFQGFCTSIAGTPQQQQARCGGRAEIPGTCEPDANGNEVVCCALVTTGPTVKCGASLEGVCQPDLGSRGPCPNDGVKIGDAGLCSGSTPICCAPKEELECRYAPGVPARKFFASYKNDAILYAVPAPPGASVDCSSPKEIGDDLLAKSGQAEIVFCLEEL